MAKKQIEQTEIEAPYELPEGWKWCKLGDFINIFRGVSYKKEDAHTEKLKNDCLIMRGGNIIEGNIDLESDNIYVDKSLVSENQYIKKYDVIIVTSTGSSKVIGRAGISYSDYSDVAFGAFLTLARPNDLAYKPYIDQYFQSSLYRERIRELASGVNINNIRTDYITDSPIPLPPTLEEQQRIVNLIETLFAKLDQAKEKAQNVVDTFETRKASILHKAFTGELTKKWREENGVGNDSWEEKSLECVCEVTSSKRIYQENQTDNGIPFLRISDLMKYIETNTISSELYISEEMYTELLQTDNVPQQNDILVTTRGTIGKCYLIKKTDKFYFQDGMISWLKKIKSTINPIYILYLFDSKEIIDQIKETQNGSTVAYLSIGMLRKLKFLCPSLLEQQEIVRILDKILEKENQAKEAAEAVLEQIDLLKKSILARAFRGEL